MTERKTDQQPDKQAAKPDKKTRFADFAKKRAELVTQTGEEAEPAERRERLTEAAPVPQCPALPPSTATPASTPPNALSSAQSTALKTSRAPGKKTDPNFVQVTVYLHKDVHNTARKMLFDDRRQFSDLVDDLVKDWIKTKTPARPTV